MSDEYIFKWAERLMGYTTEKYDNMEDAEYEIFNVIKEHMKNICENIEVNLENVEDRFTYGCSVYYTFCVKCDDEEIFIEATAYDYVDIEIDSVDQW
jgi:hypothetical protein